MSPSAPEEFSRSPASAFAAGIRSAALSVFVYVLFGTYIGIGALAHDYGFSITWVEFSTMLVWAGPAQVILVSALGAGAAPVEVAVAVGLSGVRLLPMVVALLPVIRAPQTKLSRLVLPTHFTAVSMWVESMRLAPQRPRNERVAFCNGLGAGYMTAALLAGAIGYYLAAKLPELLTAGLLFLTPMTFLVSVARNSRYLVDKLALGLALVIGPLLAYFGIGLDIMWTGVIGGTLAYAIHRFRESRR